MLAFYELTQEIKVGGDDFALTHCIIKIYKTNIEIYLSMLLSDVSSHNNSCATYFRKIFTRW